MQILIGLLAGLLLVLLIQRFWNSSGKSSSSWRWWLPVSIAVAVVLLLVVTGKMHVLVALGALLLGFAKRIPFLLRHFPVLSYLYKQFKSRQHGQPAPGQQSSVTTSLLEMSLDHDSGNMNGVVLAGPFQGRTLDTLNHTELQSLYSAAQQEYADSVAVLEAYLERRFGDQWRETEQDGAGTHQYASGGEMSEAEALDVLGLSPGASRQDIIDAHRKLMQRVHPDRGGSSDLAARVNEAKERLLKSNHAA